MKATLSKLVQAVALLACTRESPGSNLGQGTEYLRSISDIHQSFQKNAFK
jgi:hypothetical protein